MTPEKQIEQLMGSVGVLSEFMFIYFNSLRKAGFTEEQALFLTDSFIIKAVAGETQKDKKGESK